MTSSKLGQLVAPHLPVHTIQCGSSWQKLGECAVNADCAIVVIENLAIGTDLRNLMLFKTLYAHIPIVLVTAKDFDNAKELRHVMVEEVVWATELHTLPSQIQSALEKRLLFRIGLMIEQHTDMSFRLRSILGAACRAIPPIRSVAELSRRAACDRATLHRDWRLVVGARSSFHIKDFLGWIILLRARVLCGTAIGWRSTSEQLCVSEKKIYRLSRALAGLSLRRLSALEPIRVAEMFVNQLHESIGLPPDQSL